MKRVTLNLILVLALALAPLHHVFAMQAAPATQGCAEMNHDAGHGTHAADAAGDAGDNGHAGGLCNGCASCTHCSVALTSFTMPSHATAAIHHPEPRAALHDIDLHPHLRPPRFS